MSFRFIKSDEDFDLIKSGCPLIVTTNNQHYLVVCKKFDKDPQHWYSCLSFFGLYPWQYHGHIYGGLRNRIIIVNKVPDDMLDEYKNSLKHVIKSFIKYKKFKELDVLLKNIKAYLTETEINELKNEFQLRNIG